jgi:hypothetical protein
MPIPWFFSLLFGIPATYIIIANPIAGIVAARRGKSFSFVPILGGMLGFIACLTCPIAWVRWFAWVPLLHDFSIPALMYSIVVSEREPSEDGENAT